MLRVPGLDVVLAMARLTYPSDVSVQTAPGSVSFGRMRFQPLLLSSDNQPERQRLTAPTLFAASRPALPPSTESRGHLDGCRPRETIDSRWSQEISAFHKLQVGVAGSDSLAEHLSNQVTLILVALAAVRFTCRVDEADAHEILRPPAEFSLKRWRCYGARVSAKKLGAD